MIGFRRSPPADKTDPLAEVLKAENAERQRLDAERARAASWLADAQQAIDGAAAADIDRLRATAATEQQAGRRAAVDAAQEVARAAETLAARMRAIDDATLQAIVWRHVSAIDPGHKT